MHYSAFTLCLAVASAFPQVPTGPTTQSTPSKSLTLDFPSLFATGNGVFSLGDTLISSAQDLSLHIDAAYNASGQLSADVPPSMLNVGPILSLTRILTDASNGLWKTAVEAEKKVCAIASSINEQNVEAQKANLVAGINAQARVILQLKNTIVPIVTNLVQLITSFTLEERAIIFAAITALGNSAQASVVPVVRLANGLEAAGTSGLNGATSAVQASVSALIQTMSTIQIQTS